MKDHQEPFETSGLETDASEAATQDLVEKTPQLSRESVLLLCLLPFAFLTLFRSIQPWLDLLPTMGITYLAWKILRRDSGGVEKKIAFLGLGIALAMTVLFITTMGAHQLRFFDPHTGQLTTAIGKPVYWPVQILQFVIIIISIVFHESAHGIAAYFSGDPTAKKLGRVSLNPLRHIDLFGSIILPAAMILSKAGVLFGWAKPVPINPNYFRNYRRGLLSVTLAGVATNLFLAFFFAALLMTVGVLLHSQYPEMATRGLGFIWDEVLVANVPQPFLWATVIQTLKMGILINLVLLNLNILPIPPLDGFGVIESFLPASVARWVAGIHNWGLLVVGLLIFTKLLNYLLIPAILLANHLVGIVGFIAKLN